MALWRNQRAPANALRSAVLGLVLLAAHGNPAGAAELKGPHWSFLPLQSPTVPAGDNPVDAFVEAARRAKGLVPSPAAAPRELIRRVYFDLIGLPPAPEEVDAFEQDPSSERYAQLVERLLASPRYGERWGRHWLDLARYTESTGFEYDRLRDQAWPYRDYVIQSFNDDKPYDRFMQEQIAGDVLAPVTRDGIIATSLLVCGPYDQAGNAQANATQRAITREEELEDMLSVVGQTFLGLTINCARCHDHKFDPISQRDYYRVKAVFDGVKHGERPLETATDVTARTARMAALNRELAVADGAVAAIEKEGAQRAASGRTDTAREVGPEPYALWSFGGAEAGRAAASTVLVGQPMAGAAIVAGQLRLPTAGAYFQTAPLARDLREKTLEAWVALADLEQGGGAAISIESADGSRFDALVFGERQAKKWVAGSEGYARTRDLDAPEENAPIGTMVQMVAVYRADNTIALYRNGEPYGQPYQPGGALQTFRAGDAHVVLGLRHKGGGRPWLTGAIQQAALYDRALSSREVAASFRAGGLGVPLAEILARLTDAQRAARAAALVRCQRVQSELAALQKPAPVAYAGTRVQPEPTHVFLRGDVKSPGEIVTPAALSSVVAASPEFGLAADAPEAERRRQFAGWLADPRNPLPARVMANRVWQWHFGQGLVATPSDLGVNGSRPTHPELLDWLAAKFVASGWSVKALHRLIVTSATYRQSANPAATGAPALTVDADNQYLWRYQPRRLEAEAVRDAMLAVSGQLNLQPGGPSFRPFTTTDFNATFYHPFDRGDAEFNRRTVYRMNVNSGKEPLLDVLDCPDPSVKTPRRGVTTTPLQALGLMNSGFVQRQSVHLAERVRQGAPQDLPAAIQGAYRLVLGRRATHEEAQRALSVANERGLAHVCWALLNSSEFIYLR